MSYKPTPKQEEALRVLGSDALHIMLFGGSRSGKTFIAIRAIIIRALAAEGSRHAVLRFRFSHVKQSIIYDTFPKVMTLCFPDVKYDLNKSDWFVEFANKSQVWFGGLDDKERTEKILGQEYVTIYLNECSQIPYTSRNLAMTRLAQRVTHTVRSAETVLRRKCYYDCNPPSQAHWSYRLFMRKQEPDDGKGLPDPTNYISLQMNPGDNLENLPSDYLKTLEALPARLRVRFLEGRFGDITDGALFSLESLEKWRSLNTLPDMQRIVVAVDPSGSGDTDNLGNDDIGIIVAGLGTDGNGYVLEDLTVKAGPQVWGNIATTAFDRHDADVIVAEKNFGGDMVRFVIQASRPRTPFKAVTASRGKAVRAEPISALHELGKIRFAGYFPELEDELCGMTTAGYIGQNSPNRADAFVWAMTELFPGMIKKDMKIQTPSLPVFNNPQGFMAA